MKKMKPLMIMLFALFSVSALKADHLGESLTLTAKLTGSEEVPVVSTNALGVASFVLNAYRDTMCVNINVTGLSGPITGAHIHDGLPGANGPVIKDLTPYVNGNQIVVTLSGVDLSANLAKYLSGGFYVNVHTLANPGGEIRGQINLETDFSYQTMLDGPQQVPPIGTAARGVAVFNLTKDLSVMTYHVTVDGLSGALVNAHLHEGTLGVNGPVVYDLTPFIVNNTINGTIINPPASLIDSLNAGAIYINAHTVLNPGGEIRGQLTYDSRKIQFDAMLHGSQEVPAVAGPGIGSAAFQLNNAMDTLWVSCVGTGLSGPITLAHIHSGAVGVNGGVLIDLVPFITNNSIYAVITGAALTPAVINEMLKGETYINLHTAANAGGEIRGQIYRLAREGYTFDMSGDQQVPAVVSNATGGGVVTIDRDQTNAHVMLTSSGVISNSIHFHENTVGANGPVFFDLTPYYTNNGVFMYWTTTNVTPFTTAMSLKFRNDSVYVNNHSTNFPNGEIRGQAERGFVCYQGPSNIADPSINMNSLSLSPNPFTTMLYIELESDKDMDALLEVVDLTGNVVYATKEKIQTGFNRMEVSPQNVSKGFYILRLKTDNGQLVWKILKDEY